MLPADPALDPALRMIRPAERGMLRERLFLLDARRGHVAGAELEPFSTITLEKIELDGQIVGWIGFTRDQLMGVIYTDYRVVSDRFVDTHKESAQ